jgi:hypothetical protein
VRELSASAKLTAEDFRLTLQRWFDEAEQRGKTSLLVKSGDLHRNVGGYPGPGHRMPVCCSVMESDMDAGDRVVGGPRSGQGETLLIEYALPRGRRLTDAAPPTTRPPMPPSQAPNATARNRPTPPVRPAGNALYLVSCVAAKRSAPSPAKDLYISHWFTKARTYVESTGRPWFILSAQYGLLDPDTTVAPYEKTLNTMSAAERQIWAERVLQSLDPMLPGVDRVVILAGQRYRDFLVPALLARGVQVDVPMEGLRIGEQLQWLDSQRRA